MEKFFYPQGIAIIGVSDTPSNLGKYIIGNLMEFGFRGSYYAVGTTSGTLQGKPIYRSLLDIPHALDLAMILVKAEDVPSVAEVCGRKGINRLVISTAGFSEYRSERKALEKDLLAICQRHGVRFIGPNCMAVVNMENGLFLPFTPHYRSNWKKGPVGIISQSGWIATSLSQHLSYGKIGVSKVASIGNRLNMDEVDLLKYYLEDPQTEIIFLYLEGLRRANELFELACLSPKPILMHKANISSLSHGIALSHTSSLASDENVVDAAFQQAGIIRVSSYEEILNCVKVLFLPRLKGRRLVSMSGGGGTSVIIADEAQRNGFTFPSLPKAFLDWLEEKGRAEIIRLGNPVDLGDIYDMDTHIQALEKLRGLSEIDGIFYDLIHHRAWEELVSSQAFQRLFDYCSQVNDHSEVPVVIRLDLGEPARFDDLNKKISAPLFESIPGVFNAMRKVLEAQQVKPVSRPAADTNIDISGKIASVLDKAIQRNDRFLDYEGYQILEELRIPVVRQYYLPREEADKVDKGRKGRFKFPVALKAIGGNLVHKTEARGVRLNLKNKRQLSDALDTMRSESLLSSARGFLIQEMTIQGTEMIVGGKRDPQFGPVVMVGLGGILVDLFSDINLAIAPIDQGMARRMINSLKGYPLLEGYRGMAPSDIDSLCMILNRVSDLMVQFPSISEIDLNPVKVLDRGQGSVVIDCKIVLTLPQSGEPLTPP